MESPSTIAMNWPGMNRQSQPPGVNAIGRLLSHQLWQQRSGILMPSSWSGLETFEQISGQRPVPSGT